MWAMNEKPLSLGTSTTKASSTPPRIRVERPHVVVAIPRLVDAIPDPRPVILSNLAEVIARGC